MPTKIIKKMHQHKSQGMEILRYNELINNQIKINLDYFSILRKFAIRKTVKTEHL